MRIISWTGGEHNENVDSRRNLRASPESTKGLGKNGIPLMKGFSSSKRSCFIQDMVKEQWAIPFLEMRMSLYDPG